LIFRTRGERLRRDLDEGGHRLTDSAGKELGSSELMALVATSSLSGTHSSPTRLFLLALGAAVAVAVAVLALV
jgi:hypothetical protein